MSLTFFTDRDLGKNFPAILREAGILVERHADHFPPNAADEDWLTAVAGRSWIVLTHDLEAFVARNDAPFIARIYRPSIIDLSRRPDAPGRVELWLSREMWVRQSSSP